MQLLKKKFAQVNASVLQAVHLPAGVRRNRTPIVGLFALIGFVVFGQSNVAAQRNTPLRFEGVVSPLEFADVSVENEGLITEIAVRPGDLVVREEWVAKLSRDSFSANVSKAESSATAAQRKSQNVFRIKSLEEELRGRQRRLKRINSLLSNSKTNRFTPVTSSEIDELESTIAKLQMDIQSEKTELIALDFESRAAQQDAELAKIDLARTVIHSPLTGVVVDLHKQLGEYAKPGDRIASVMRMDRLQLRFEIPLATLRRGKSLGINSIADLVGLKVEIEVPPLQPDAEPFRSIASIDRIVQELLTGDVIRAFVEFDNQEVTNMNDVVTWQCIPGQIATLTPVVDTVSSPSDLDLNDSPASRLNQGGNDLNEERL